MIVLAKYLIFIGIYFIFTPLLGSIYFRIFKRTTSPIPFVGSVFILIGNFILFLGDEYMWGYALSIIIVPFDCGIRFLIKEHMENSRNRDTIDKDEN